MNRHLKPVFQTIALENDWRLIAHHENVREEARKQVSGALVDVHDILLRARYGLYHSLQKDAI